MSSYIRFFRQPTIVEWAQSVLSPTELNDFQNSFQENNQLWEQYQQNGLINVEPIYEILAESMLENSIEVHVGDKITLASDTSVSDLHMTDRYQYWLDRFTETNGPDSVQFVANIA